MNIFKGFALSILSFLLFLSLSLFGFALTINYTILNPNFVVSELDRLDLPSLAEEMLSGQIQAEEQFFADAIDSTIADLEPWIKEQARSVNYAAYDYLLGKRQDFNVSVPLEPLRESLTDNMRQAVLQSPPPEIAMHSSPEIVEQYIDEVNRQISEQIPSTFNLDLSLLEPEELRVLEQTREGIHYFQIGYQALIGFMLLLVLGIILIHRQVKGATRDLGITFATYGGLEYAGVWVTKYLSTTHLPGLEITPSLDAWIPQLVTDFLAPLEMFSLGILITGAILLVVSFVYRRGQPVSHEAAA